MYWDIDLVNDDWGFVRSISFRDNLVNHCASDRLVTVTASTRFNPANVVSLPNAALC